MESQTSATPLNAVSLLECLPFKEELPTLDLTWRYTKLLAFGASATVTLRPFPPVHTRVRPSTRQTAIWQLLNSIVRSSSCTLDFR